jgi:hypothetical protein
MCANLCLLLWLGCVCITRAQSSFSPISFTVLVSGWDEIDRSRDRPRFSPHRRVQDRSTDCPQSDIAIEGDLATLLVRAHSNADLLAAKQVPELVSVLMDAKVPGVHQAVRGMCLDDVRSIQLQSNAVLTPIESREQLFLRGNRVDFQLVALRRISRFGNMAMRQARSSQDVDQATLERHHASLFGDVDDRVDSRSYKERYDALHHSPSSEHPSAVTPDPPSLRAAPLLTVTAVLGLCGAFLLFVAPRVAPLVQYDRLRAAEVRYRCSRMSPDAADEADVARDVDAESLFRLATAFVRREWFGEETFHHVPDPTPPPPPPPAMAPTPAPTPAPARPASPKKKPVVAKPKKENVTAPKVTKPKKPVEKPIEKPVEKPVEKPPVETSAKQRKKQAKQEKQAQVKQEAEVVVEAEPVITAPEIELEVEPKRAVSPDVPQETHSASPTPPAAATPRAASPTDTTSSTRSELDPADGHVSAAPIAPIVPTAAAAAGATVAEPPGLVVQVHAPVVDALGAPPGIGDSMRHRAVLPVTLAPPVLAPPMLLPSGANLFTPEQLWEQQQLLEQQRLQLQQLFFNLRGLSAASELQAPPPLAPLAPMQTAPTPPRETLGDVFNTNLFFLSEDQQQAEQHS